ncbi:phospholipid scramblase family member 5-like isoform X2 [Leguminivora glycinivorella]|uniref:phospholipid scramblase family member 5-like isoform X2 n=1 Tax=Leguminivora glycinivorella TaxID=1035111 RepID=UPI00200F7208|nr:phospholipid scramblase family member 5-like isoform X2 [Leguminivora glycinivorella]
MGPPETEPEKDDQKPLQTMEASQILEPIQTLEPLITLEPLKNLGPPQTLEPLQALEPLKNLEPLQAQEPLQTLEPLQLLQPFDDQKISKEVIELTEASAAFGIQDLAGVEKLMITKKVAMKQLLSLQSQRSRYIIKAADSALTYSVLEENTWWLGFLCYGLRPCQLKILNKAGEEVIRILRPFAFTTRVTPCQLQRMQVYSPPDKLIGTIEQIWTPVKPCYFIKGPDGENLFSVQGPSNTLGIYRDLHFDIVGPAGVRVGSTWKRWRGLAHALFRSPTLDKFGLAFQKDLSVEEKALLLASSLLIDYMYYDT